jgi:hypothetical protein
VLDPSLPYLRRFFDVDRVHRVLHYKRICTLELLFEKCSAVFG